MHVIVPYPLQCPWREFLYLLVLKGCWFALLRIAGCPNCINSNYLLNPYYLRSYARVSTPLKSLHGMPKFRGAWDDDKHMAVRDHLAGVGRSHEYAKDAAHIFFGAHVRLVHFIVIRIRQGNRFRRIFFHKQNFSAFDLNKMYMGRKGMMEKTM